MKSTYLFIITLLLFSFISCETKKGDKRSDDKIIIEDQSVSTLLELGRSEVEESGEDAFERDSDMGRYFFRKATNEFFESRLRLEEKLYTNIQYIDTVEYVGYNDEGDYWHIGVKKDTSEVWLINDIPFDTLRFDLKEGERVRIVWEMDSMWIAGDGESLWVDEWINQLEKINN